MVFVKHLLRTRAVRPTCQVTIANSNPFGNVDATTPWGTTSPLVLVGTSATITSPTIPSLSDGPHAVYAVGGTR